MSALVVLVSFSMLSPLLLAAGAFQCREKEPLLTEISGRVAQLTDCLLQCSGMTYIKKLQLQDSRTIRMEDSTEGDFGEYCWSTELKCTVGERFEDAYVVLPVSRSAVGHELLEVRTTATRLQAHNSPTTIADDCGLRYHATQHFSMEKAGTPFCVRVVAQDDDEVLRCPPFLVTFWQRDQS